MPRKNTYKLEGTYAEWKLVWASSKGTSGKTLAERSVRGKESDGCWICENESECEIRATWKLLSYGSAFRPNTVGQPTNFRAEK